MKLLLPLAVLAATLTMPATSWAAEGPVAGCPAGKVLLPVEDTLNRVDYSIYSPADAAAVRILLADLDVNGNHDGYLCSKQFKPNQGQDKHWGGIDYVITQIGDNGHRLRDAILRRRTSR